MALGYTLMTIAILQFTLVPLLADISGSHAMNPAWPAHAKFHVVTQVMTTSALGGLAHVFLWSDWVEASLGICIAMTLALVALCGFFVSAISAPLYGGQVAAPAGLAGGRIGKLDGNVANFGVSLILLIIGRALLL